MLVFSGERVLKLRKPLRFDFVDFSTRSARADDCRREVELNRRLAPDVYLGVADITMGGEVLDHAVVMRRLPGERSLAHLIRAEPESVWGTPLGEVAETLAAFHARADRSGEITANAARDAIRDRFEVDATVVARFVGPVLDRDVHDATLEAVRTYLSGREPLFQARMEADQICDGHGDLQAEDIYCLDDGPRILDCLEFDDHLRAGDVAADVAFLVMDLERLGHPEAGARFVRDYEDHARAPIPPSLLHAYVALRAFVRTKVACIRHEQGDLEAAQEAVQLLGMARAHLERIQVRLVLVGGLPGSGKSTLASALGGALGVEVLRSDELRREESDRGDDLPVTFGQGRYASSATQAVYDALLEATRQRLGSGESVILDASWIDAAHREAAEALAKECRADLIELHLTAPRSVTEQRITARLRDGTDQSEATVEISRDMAGVEALWPTAVTLDTARSPEAVLAEALRVIAARPGRTLRQP